MLAREASEVTAVQYPDILHLGDLTLALSYHFEPNHPRDGVTLRVPAPLLPMLPVERLEWLVPGLIEAKCIALVRNLPKALRKNFVPVPDFVKAALQRMVFAESSLPQALGRELLRMTGARVSDEAWAESAQQVENHLKMNLEVVDRSGGTDRTLRPGQPGCLGRAADREEPAAGGSQGLCRCRRNHPAEDCRSVDDGLPGAGGRGRHGQGKPFLHAGRGRVPAPSGVAATIVATGSDYCCNSWPSRRSACVASCRA